MEKTAFREALRFVGPNLHQIYCGLSNQEGWDGRGVWHVWTRG